MKKSSNNFNRNLLIGVVIVILLFVFAYYAGGYDSEDGGEGLASGMFGGMFMNMFEMGDVEEDMGGEMECEELKGDKCNPVCEDDEVCISDICFSKSSGCKVNEVWDQDSSSCSMINCMEDCACENNFGDNFKCGIENSCGLVAGETCSSHSECASTYCKWDKKCALEPWVDNPDSGEEDNEKEEQCNNDDDCKIYLGRTAYCLKGNCVLTA